MTILDPADIIPIRVLEARTRDWRDALHVGAAEGFVSLVLNLIVLAGLVHLAFPQNRPTSEPNSITVDLVPEVPKAETGASSKNSPAAKAADQPPAPQAANDSPPPSDPGSPPTPARSASPAQEPPVLSSPAAAAPAPGAPDATKDGGQAASVAQAPAPLDAGRDPAPHLVAPPTDPAPAAEQDEKNRAGNAEAKAAEPSKAVETPPAPQPEVVTTPSQSATALPPPAATAEQSRSAPPNSGEVKREAENTAKLSAALPFAQSFAVDMHRAALSGSGATDASKYRGEVYGAFRKADGLVEQARAKHLRGQAVIEFSVDDGGNLTGARVALSSGDPAVDATALAMIRQSAPYPPPPPGAPHTFSPAIRLGLDD